MEKGSSTAISLMLAGGMLVFPFVLANPQPPILSFQAEWLAIALGVVSSFALLTRQDIELANAPTPARWLIAFALFLLVQTAFVDTPYLQMPILGLLYALYAALLVWLGMQLALSAGVEKTIGILAAFLCAGAIANATAGVIQFYGRPIWLEDWIAQMYNGRASGNTGQINLYGNYLALGQISLLYLWVHKQLRTAWTIVAALLLAYASALSGARGALLYLVWIAAMGFLAARMLRNTDAITALRIRKASFALALISMSLHILVPWINSLVIHSPAGIGSFERLATIGGTVTEPRWQAWRLALLIFFSAPIVGVGIGQFAGAASEMGLPPDLASYVWSSPHNLVFHLLAETGILGTVVGLGALVAWWSRTAYRFRSSPTPALWLLISAVGIEMLHSATEFPLWRAQFLGATALLMGVGLSADAESTRRSSSVPQFLRSSMTPICFILVIALGIMLRDFWRLDVARVTGTQLTLRTEMEKTMASHAMSDLSNGPLGPVAEGWILLGASLDRDNLPYKLALSERVVRFWPDSQMMARRAVFLSLHGDNIAALNLIRRAIRDFPGKCDEIILILKQAPPENSDVIMPLLASVQNTSECHSVNE